jgi:hypothetical protein
MVQHECVAMIDALFAFGGSVLYEFGGALFCIACSSVMFSSPFFYVMEGEIGREGDLAHVIKGVWNHIQDQKNGAASTVLERIKNYIGICFVAVVASKMKIMYVSQLIITLGDLNNYQNILPLLVF